MMNLKGWIAILVVCCAYRFCAGNCDGLGCKIKDCQGNVKCILRMPKFFKEQGNVPQGQTNYRPISTDHCDREDCSGHGTCHSTGDSYYCSCNTGYSGHTCHDYICDHHHCSGHGTCHLSTHSSHSYTCTCETGYYGQDCQDYICDHHHCNGNGRCHPTHNYYTCTCDTGYSGLDCQDYICDHHHCSGHGTCHPSTHSSHSYSCTCETGYSGQDCQDYICDNHHCSGHGTCHPTHNYYTCTCDTGYSGQYCQDYICDHHHCNGHGTCHPTYFSYTCTCNTGYSGQDCQDYICDHNHCSGHGTCHPTYYSYTCTCDTGYSGQDCQDYICDHHHCSGHGTCHPTYYSYTCTCYTGYSGQDCQAGGFLSCNATGLMEDIIMSKPASSAYAFQCPTSTTRSPEAFVLNHCSVPQSPASWNKGVKVMSYCTATANQNLNLYTPVALMNPSYITASTTDIAGVFVGCLDGGSGFKMATQSCDNNPHIVHIETDANNYFAIV